MLLVLCTAVALSLLSWSIADPSVTHAASGSVRNWVGPLGAIVSDLLVQLFGLASIVLILPPAFWAMVLANQGYLPHPKRKLVFAPLAVVCLALACSSLPLSTTWPLRHGYGGVVGDLAYARLAEMLALVNAARAGMAAGLFGLAFGVICLQRSFGLTRADLATVFQQRSAMGPRATAASPSPPTQPSWPQPATQHTYAPPPLAQVYAPPAPPAYAPPAPPACAPPAPPACTPAAPAWIEPYFAPPPTQPAYPPLAAVPEPALSAPNPHVTNQRQAWLRPFPHRSGQPATTSQDRPPATSRSHAPQFDRETAEQSRTIASRFAPGSAGPGASYDTRPDSARPSAVEPAPASQAPRRSPAIIMPEAPHSVPRPIAPGGFYDRLAGSRQDLPAQGYRRPSFNYLHRGQAPARGADNTADQLRERSQRLLETLADFGINGEIVAVRPGPVVTLFEFEPARGTKSSRVIGLADDIARSMSARAVRIAVVPGVNAIGIELPNATRQPVSLRDLLETENYQATAPQSGARLPLALGRSIGGEPVIADLARMPHLLVAGTTGAGKSVGVNAMILSLLYRLSPAECRLILIDPKMLELSVYNGIPHLLTPVVTDPNKAVAALNWAVGEMERRYQRMAALSVRNIEGYNTRISHGPPRDVDNTAAGAEKSAPMPYIVIVVDEFADLMAVAGKEIECAVQRLAQMARAAGIHLIMATQRPSVDIITGTIKANFPTRISFRVTSRIDSRTILNEQGAEQLLGQGDMLYAAGSGPIVRVHGPFVSDAEVEQIAGYLCSLGAPGYIDGVTDMPEPEPDTIVTAALDEDELYDRAVALVRADQRTSISYLQRRLSIGYNRAAGLLERMERDSIVGPANGAGKRALLTGSIGNGGEPAASGSD